jgi:cytochrome c oxidase subunit I
MPRADWAPFGFLLAGLIMAALPVWAVSPVWYGGSLPSNPIDSALHDTYYVVAHWHIGLLPPVASIIFGLAYLVGRRLFQLEFRTVWVWFHLILWIAGITMLLGPLLAVSAAQVHSRDYAVGYSVDFEAIHKLTTVGYCVTLLSSLVFAICFGEAIFKRLRRGKEL